MATPPTQRVLHARVAAHKKWAKTDPVEGTAKARQAALDRFEREVDPDNTLSPTERARRAEHARKAYFLSLALKSAVARGSKKTAPRTGPTDAQVEGLDGSAGEVMPS